MFNCHNMPGCSDQGTNFSSYNWRLSVLEDVYRASNLLPCLNIIHKCESNNRLSMATSCILVGAIVINIYGWSCSFPSIFFSRFVLLSYSAPQILRKSASTKIELISRPKTLLYSCTYQCSSTKKYFL